MRAGASRASFDQLPDGRPVEVVTLNNGQGMSARILSWGAILQSFCTPDRSGRTDDIVLGYDELEDYLKDRTYFGAAIGRYANRIAGGRFELDGRSYQLARNDGRNSLHGGPAGLHKRLWTIAEVRDGPEPAAVLSYLSPDGEEGYPGALQIRCAFSLSARGELSIELGAVSDAATIVGLTHHSYFNLAGHRAGASILSHRLRIPAETFTPVDDGLIPTGELRAVAGTPFDFRTPREIGERIRDGSDPQILHGRGYDHNWAVAARPTPELHLMARLEEPASGRILEVVSNQPGLQFYSGNFLDGALRGRGGRLYRQSDGLCLEPQLYPDTPNQPGFGSARLDPGQSYLNRIVYRCSSAAREETESAERQP
jgi:aldose 1-epimerase